MTDLLNSRLIREEKASRERVCTSYEKVLGMAYPQAAKCARDLNKSIEQLIADGWEYKGRKV